MLKTTYVSQILATENWTVIAEIFPEMLEVDRLRGKLQLRVFDSIVEEGPLLGGTVLKSR